MNGILAAICAFALSLALCFVELRLLKKLKAGQQILGYVAEHKQKSGTPTMGGIAFIVAVAACGLAFCNLTDGVIPVAVAVFVAYGAIGFLDDFVKLRYKRNEGLKPYQKILFQTAVAVTVAVYVYRQIGIGSTVYLPFTGKDVDIGFWIVPLVAFIFVACTNGVNLTDGIDGLATTTTIVFLVGTAVLVQGKLVAAEKVGDTYGAEVCRNLITLCMLSVGALCAFLLFNVNDAKMFMGDTGSLALGALVACVAIFSRLSLFVPVVGLMFVVSCLSVIIQVVYFKLSGGKRVFLMAPFHHHLQHKGWSESRICVLYAVVTALTTLVLVYFGE